MPVAPSSRCGLAASARKSARETLASTITDPLRACRYGRQPMASGISPLIQLAVSEMATVHPGPDRLAGRCSHDTATAHSSLWVSFIDAWLHFLGCVLLAAGFALIVTI